MTKVFMLLIMLLVNSSVIFAKEYKVAVRAHSGVDYAFKQWQHTVSYLNERIPEHNFSLIPVLKLKEIIERSEKGDFDFVITNPSSFVELQSKYGALALVTLINKRGDSAQDRFGSVIFTHVRNVDVLSINDLKGKALMAVSERAFGGWNVARLEMIKNDFNPNIGLGELHFSTSMTHPEVVHAVLDGIADVGVVRTDHLERMEASGKIDMRYLRILNNKDVKDFPYFLSTELYPEWPFTVLKHVPDKDVKRVVDVLLSISEYSIAAKMGEYVGWKSPSNYSSVKNMMFKLNLNIKRN